MIVIDIRRLSEDHEFEIYGSLTYSYDEIKAAAEFCQVSILKLIATAIQEHLDEVNAAMGEE